MRSWHQAEPGPVVLVSGAETLLADRAVAAVRRLAHERHGRVETSTLDAAGYLPGQLAVLASPSLFEEPRVIVTSNAESCTDAFLTDVLAYLAAPADDVTLVVRHAGGQRGKKLLEAVRSMPGAVLVDCPPMKSPGDKHDFVTAELAQAGRRITLDAVRAVVAAVGSDLRELASACAQLVADTSGDLTGSAHITVADVDRYYAGRVETTGFRVADAVAAGHRDQALGLLRQAVASGVDPVPIVAVIALKLRTMALVAGAQGSATEVSRALGLQAWQVERARRDLRSWTPEGMSVAIRALAAADEAVKGGGRDAVYAVERAVVQVTGAC